MDLLTNIINFTLDNRKERDYNQNPSLRKEKSEKFYGTKENSDKRRGCVSVSGGHQQFRRAFNATFGLWNFGDFKRAICVSTGAAEADSWNLDVSASELRFQTAASFRLFRRTYSRGNSQTLPECRMQRLKSGLMSPALRLLPA